MTDTAEDFLKSSHTLTHQTKWAIHVDDIYGRLIPSQKEQHDVLVSFVLWL